MEGIPLIKIEAEIDAPIEGVWEYWNEPDHVKKWNTASEEWHTPKAENDLRVGGEFSYRMESNDGTDGFDFSGVYDEIKKHEVIAYTLGDGRKVRILFRDRGVKTEIVEEFEAERTNPIEMQRDGWQSILNNFKKYAEEKNNRVL